MDPLIKFREYQDVIFWDRTTGIVVLHWSRQIGKSFTLGAWAVDRLLTRPGRLVTVLSNSRDNGAEFVSKCAEVCEKMRIASEQVDESPDMLFENMRMETRITVGKKVGRIKVLAANPRTARGFSGDLILDEFAFHENSAAIWEAAEPILSSNPDFICRIASTGNGKFNMFYRMATSGQFRLSRVTRTDAYRMGVKIYDANTRQPITPEEARAQALDKRAYDQNYECMFCDENMTLLTHELISAAEMDDCGVICDGDWSAAAWANVVSAAGPLFVGVDIGRNHDLTVVTVIEKIGPMRFVRAILRLENMRLPQQQERIGRICSAQKFVRACLDQTGLGLGLVEYLQEAHGTYRIQGINFASSVPVTNRIQVEGRKSATVRVTEAMATELLARYEDRTIKHPRDSRLRDDLRKPERVTSPGGSVSIAATRDEAGHADHFWSFALAVEAASDEGMPGHIVPIPRGGVRAEARQERCCEG